MVARAAVGAWLGQPATYLGTPADVAHILTYTAPHLRNGRRRLVELTLQVLPLPLGAAAQTALQIDWYVTMAGWI